MLFVIDVGNTHTVSGIVRQDDIVVQWRIKTDSQATADELSVTYRNLFVLSDIDFKDITDVVISSVVPQLDGAYRSWCTALFKGSTSPTYLNVTHESVSSLIPVLLDNPSEVGADRLVNGIAAFNLCQTSSIVIDFGTAITFDCISDKCEYLGGLILPGLSLALSALSAKAAKLPAIDITKPPNQVIGKSTVAAMKSGVMHGYGAMIEGLITKITHEMAGSPQVVATGGMAAIISPYTHSIDKIEPDLTLAGLAYIHKQLSVR